MGKKNKNSKTTENPLLQKIQLPGEFIRLPSKGIFYKNGELSDNVSDGEIEILPMKTIDEINLKTPDMIYKGTAIERVFSRCVPSIKKPLKLLSQDVDYILACLRKSSYGDILEIKASCECTKHKEYDDYKIDLAALINNNTIEFDVSNIEDEYVYEFKHEHTNSTQIIEFRPVLFEDLVKIYQYQTLELNDVEDDNYVDRVNEFITLNFVSSIESVDGISDVKLIKEWADDLSIEQSERIARYISAQTEWGTSFEYKVKCVHCDADIDVSPSLNPVSFFMLPLSHNQKT